MSETQWQLEQDGDKLVLRFAGSWLLGGTAPAAESLLARLDGSVAALVLDMSGVTHWDSLLASTVLRLQRHCEERGIRCDASRLPEGLTAMLALANAVPAEPAAREGLLGWGASILLVLRQVWLSATRALGFTGEVLLSLWRLLGRRAHCRARDFWFFVGQNGPAALGIISLVSVLAGVILAYLGAVQLKQFGAQVYVANLVSIGMTREMGALMAGIIMAGRTGAAYAAQLATMQANEEVDALNVMGINPVDFLVLPRLLALVLVLPLLTLYADVLGMVGGALIAGTMDIGLTQYIVQTQASISLQSLADGLWKSLVFAWLIAQAGCYCGLQSGRSSTDVGIATTRAVVSSLVAIIIADSLLNVLYDRLGI